MQLLLTALLAIMMAPCVVQQCCPTSLKRRHPATVCIHRVQSSRCCSLVVVRWSRVRDARAHKSHAAAVRALMFLWTVLQVVELLYQLPLHLFCRENMTWLLVLAVLGAIAGTHQGTTGCKNCILLGKEEKAMFRAHSEACITQSQVDPKLVESMLGGELVDDPALKRHVYCVLLKCKVISKDGKLQKAAVLGKLANRADSKNETKVLENCADQSGGDTPEDLAWNLFRCGYDHKAVLFNYMPAGGRDIENNSN